MCHMLKPLYVLTVGVLCAYDNVPKRLFAIHNKV